MDRPPTSGNDNEVLTRRRFRPLRHLEKGVSTPVAVVAGLLIFSIDALVAPAYGLNVLYIVLLIAMIPCGSKRQIAWITAGCMLLSALGFVIGQGGTPSGENVARLVINLGALAITALLIIGLYTHGPGLFLGRARTEDREIPMRDPERVALFARLAETVSIADEAIQQLTATILGSAACRNWLDKPVPDLAEARAAIDDSIASARRAGELVQRLRRFRPGLSCRAMALPEPGLDRR